MILILETTGLLISV